MARSRKNQTKYTEGIETHVIPQSYSRENADENLMEK